MPAISTSAAPAHSSGTVPRGCRHKTRNRKLNDGNAVRAGSHSRTPAENSSRHILHEAARCVRHGRDYRFRAFCQNRHALYGWSHWARACAPHRLCELRLLPGDGRAHSQVLRPRGGRGSFVAEERNRVIKTIATSRRRSAAWPAPRSRRSFIMPTKALEAADGELHSATNKVRAGSSSGGGALCVSLDRGALYYDVYSTLSAQPQ